MRCAVLRRARDAVCRMRCARDAVCRMRCAGRRCARDAVCAGCGVPGCGVPGGGVRGMRCAHAVCAGCVCAGAVCGCGVRMRCRVPDAAPSRGVGARIPSGRAGCVACARSAMCVTSVVRSRMLRSLCTSRRVCTRRGRVDGDCVAIRGACGAVRRAAPGCVACARSAMCVTSVVRSRMLRSLCTSRRVCTRRGRVDGDCVAIRGACGRSGGRRRAASRAQGRRCA